MDKKFSIRKLAVGVVSVSIGITGLSTISTDNITFANYNTPTVSSSSEYNGEIIYNIDGTILDFQAYVIKNKNRVLFNQMGGWADTSLINKKTGEKHDLGYSKVKNVQDIGQVFVLESGSYELNGITHGEYELVLDIYGFEKNTNKQITLKLSKNIVYGENVTSQNESNNKDNNESKPEENKTNPEYELSLSNKKVIAYDFLKELTYPTLEKLRTDIINATEEDIYSLSHKASAIKQISSIKNLNDNDKERYINEILKADLRSDLSTIIGKVLENDIIETSNLSDKHKNRLKEILNTLSQENYSNFFNIISSALAINESKDLSAEEKEAFFDEFINKYTSAINQDTPSLDYETLYKMDVSILINKLSYLTDEDKKLYKEKVFAQKPGFGFAGAGELEYRIGFFTKDKILKNSEYTLESIKEFDAYKEAVAKNEELRKKKESEPTFDSKTENADIPFETIYKEDNTLDKGTEVTETEGINGVKEITTTYTIINGIRQDNPKVEEKVTKEKTDKVVRRGTKVTSSETEKSTQNIPFETIYKEDNTLDKGTEVVTTEGINGVKEITTTYIIINGVRQDNPKVEEKVTKEKVDKVVRRGTKVTSSETEKSTQNIPFETIYKDDNTLDKGKEVVIT